ncbi:izumo sperm-egg fusion protein 2 isoform X2 [Erinaceus europaeus]|uniref:Izumo sperm-egg fusion protein 2 isoform X2 n=1 Tax=Erinaceus europaeus TaxID=9365 RepID=A0ABM3W288_ERIEU|nr:izumo sperm-egg fusion protein 2 isoform X2 [Erinaceus europaeus]
MPAALALLLLLALGARGARGCLQCDPSVRQALGELRAALSPKRIHLERLQARAQALLLAMEGPFFRDYAVNAFLGKVDLNDLELVASFTKNQTTQLRQGPLTDMPLLDELVTLRERVVKELKKVLKSYELKGLLKEEVLDCLHCQKTSPMCIKNKYCFVDGQPRMSLQYKEGRGPRSQVLLGMVISVALAALLFVAILVSAVTYRENRKLLLK